MGEPHTTYFGLWSAKKIQEASNLLSALDVRFEVQEETTKQEVLEDWHAWDPTAANPYVAFNLWILTVDLPKVGLKIVERFPERKFGAP
jgi:hypothetical protein